MLQIAGVIPVEHFKKYFMDTIENLHKGEWFTNRMSACSLYALAYKRLNGAADVIGNLRDMFSNVCQDDTPMVRRAAVMNMPNLIAEMSKDEVISFILPLYKKLCSDCQDSVRLLTVSVLPAIANMLSSDEVKLYVIDTFLSLCNDKSWRIRYMVAENYISLAECTKGGISDQELCERFSVLLLDREAEVRAAAASHLPELCEQSQLDDVLKVILPPVKSLVDDPSQHVRVTVAERINDLSKTFGEQKTLSELLPLLLHLLKDEASEVRLNVISHLEAIIEVIGFKTLADHLLPPIAELAEDKKWRVRLAIIQKIPILARQARMELNDILQHLCTSWLKDPIYMIRELAARNLKVLTEIFGVPWIKQIMFPNIMEMAKSKNYHYRLTTLTCLKTIVPVVSSDAFLNDVLGAVIMLYNDPIPNIRLNVSLALHEIMLAINEKDREDLIKKEILPVINELRKDKDEDVSYYSEIAYKAAESILDGQTPPPPVAMPRPPYEPAIKLAEKEKE